MLSPVFAICVLLSIINSLPFEGDKVPLALNELIVSDIQVYSFCTFLTVICHLLVVSISYTTTNRVLVSCQYNLQGLYLLNPLPMCKYQPP